MLKKIILIGLISFIFLITAGIFYLNHVFIPQHLKPIVIELLEKSLEKKVSIEKASYFPFKGVLFSEINIVNKDQTPFLAIEKVDLKFKSVPKVKGKQVFAQTHLIVQGIDFKQQQLMIKGSSLVDVDLQAAGADELDFKATITLDNLKISGIQGIVDITKISGKIICTQETFFSDQLAANIGGQVLTIVLKGTYDKDSVQLETFGFDYGRTRLSTQGKIYDYNNPQLELTATANIDLKDIEKVLKGSTLPPLSGECSINAKANGAINNLETLTADMTANMPGGSVDKIKFSNLKAQVTLKQGIVNLPAFDCVFYQGKINGLGQAKIIDATIPMKASVDITQINIGPLVQDVIGQDVGKGLFDGHVEVSGGASDLNLISGSGWFKMVEGQVQMPSNFAKVAQTLGVKQLAKMEIHEASATFSIKDGKIETQDLLLLADEATMTGKGYVDLEQYVDFEARFKLSPEFVQSIGGMGQLLSFVSDETGATLATVRVYDKIAKLKYKVIPLPVKEIVKKKLKSELKQTIKNMFKKDEKSQQMDTSGKDNLEEVLKKGLKDLFK